MVAATNAWDAAQAWQHALAATAAISILPTLILPFIPARASLPGSPALKVRIITDAIQIFDPALPLVCVLRCHRLQDLTFL
jgi:hypothetical protein